LAHALTLDSKRAAVELYQILRELDPSRWRADLAQSLRPRIEALRSNLREITARADTPALSGMRARLGELAELLEQALPSTDRTNVQQRWEDFRLSVSPAYERLAASLSTLDIHVPALRPTNYARNIFHIGNALLCAAIIHWMVDVHSTIIVTLVAASLAWSMEISRRFVPRINDLLMWIFRPFAHPHEAWRVNSATWYATALVILALVQDLTIASTAIIVLGFADPAAAVIGRRFGKVKLLHGRSLEGSCTFVLVGTVSAWLWLLLAHDFTPMLALSWAIAGALAGALAELFSRRIDDNLSIPLSVAAGLLLNQAFLAA
jgi:dolichol kinase